MSRRVALWILALTVAVHVALGFSFALRTPFRTEGILLGQRDPTGGYARSLDIGAPDERQHANYIARLARRDGLPVFDPKDPALYENYQAHQPPLYYGLVSAVAKGSPTAESGIAFRWPNLLFGAGSVAGIFFFGWWGFRRWDVAAAMAMVAAPWPMFCALSGAVSNDPLLILLCTWALAFLASALNDGWTLRAALGFGVCAGLASLTKTTGIVLLPLAGLAMLLVRPSLRLGLAALAPAVLLPLPWFLRNLSLYGDPFALRAFNEAFVGSAQKSTILGVIAQSTPGVPPETSYWINWVGWWTFRSLVGVFGYMDVWLNERGTPFNEGPNALYRGLLLLFVGALLGSVLWLRKGGAQASRRVVWLAAAALALFILVFVRFNSQYFQAQGRYVLPGLAPLCLLLVGGLGFLLKGRVTIAGGVIGLLFLGTSISALDRLPDEFAKRTAVTSR